VAEPRCTSKYRLEDLKRVIVLRQEQRKARSLSPICCICSRKILRCTSGAEVSHKSLSEFVGPDLEMSANVVLTVDQTALPSSVFSWSPDFASVL
jgi:hypothetical protein